MAEPVTLSECAYMCAFIVMNGRTHFIVDIMVGKPITDKLGLLIKR